MSRLSSDTLYCWKEMLGRIYPNPADRDTYEALEREIEEAYLDALNDETIAATRPTP